MSTLEWLFAELIAISVADPWDWQHEAWVAGADMIVRLEEVDVSSLSEAQRIDYAVAWDRCLRHVEARRIMALAAACGPKPKDRAQDAAVHDLCGSFRLAPGQMGARVDTARELTLEFPRTLALMDEGKIPFTHALTLIEWTAQCDAKQAEQVETIVLPRAPFRTPYQHTAAVKKAVAKVLPEPDPEGPGSPSAERRVFVRESSEGSGTVWAQGPVEQAAAIGAAIEAEVRKTPRSADDPRTLDQKRWDALRDLVTKNASISVDLVGYLNPDGTISIPSLPGIGDLTEVQVAKLIDGGTLRFHNPGKKPPATESYFWTTAQRNYLRARDRKCRFPGCHVAAERCELDHIRTYSEGGRTDVDNGVCACKRHHRVKHQPGWKIALLPDGSVEWISPTGHTMTDPPFNEL